MKKLLSAALVLLLSLTLLASCDALADIFGGVTNDVEDNQNIPNTPSNPDDKPGEDEGGQQPGTPDKDPEDEPDTPNAPEYAHVAFTSEDTNLFVTYIGKIIPFAACNEYYIEGYYDTDDYEHGINYYTVGNSADDFAAYRALYSNYTLADEYYDEQGNKWYNYTSADVVVDMSYYYSDGEFYIDVFVYSSLSTEPDDDTTGGDDNTGGGTTGGTDKPTSYIYTDFTSAERALFMQYIGAVIPFVPNNEYYVEGYYDTDDYEHGMCFYTFGNTAQDFASYRNMFVGYTLTDTYTDDYGDTWYCYEKGDVVVDLAYYYYDGENVIDVYVYSSLSTDIEDDTTGGGTTGGGTTGGGTTGGGSTDDSDIDIITNDGKGLPEDADGVYDLDFTKAENVRNVTDQGYYIDGCPTVGSPKVLVIPVEFTDARAASKGYSLTTLTNAFKGANGTTDYYSVYEYYYISSYGKLTLDITVLDEWFSPQYASSYYANQKDSDGNLIGDQIIMDEALAYLADKLDLSDFDSDGNDIIDAVVLINTLDIGEDDFHWAYRYWNMYTDDSGYYYEYDGVSANDYLWASYQFLHDSGYNDDDSVAIDEDAVNTYTYIHEFGHVLGADDYYDTSYSGVHPMDGHDIMDSMNGDHNAYTKFNFGWLTASRLVVADGSITLTLEAFAESGDTLIIANNWDDSLGAYQEYYVIAYYTSDGLNSGEGNGYFSRDGIVVYHVNASLYKEVYEGETYYDVYNNNTDPSDEYGTENNLIEFVLSDDDAYTYIAGDSLPAGVTDDNGDALAYGFTVVSLTDSVATITFTKN